MKSRIFFNLLFVFVLISCLGQNDKGIIRKLPPLVEIEQEHDLNNAINVFIDGNNQLFIDNDKVDITGLKLKIREYENKNKSESIILLQYKRETSYSTYINVQNAIVGEINTLRKTYSKEKYKIVLDSLNKIQLSEVREIYPLNLVEKLKN